MSARLDVAEQEVKRIKGQCDITDIQCHVEVIVG